MAQYKSVLIEAGEVSFYPKEVRYSVSRASNATGRRAGESISARIFVTVDAQSTSNLSQENLITLWEMSTESADPLYSITVTWFRDDAEDVVAAVEGQGWVSGFAMSNPTDNDEINNLLQLEFTVTLDDDNVSAHKLTN